MIDDDPKRPLPWPRRWCADEILWRDITVHAAGTAVVLLVGVVFAALARYLGLADPKTTATHALIFCTGVGIWLIDAFIVVIYVFSVRTTKRSSPRKGVVPYSFGLAVPMLLLAGGPTGMWLYLAITAYPILTK